jgi:hypothetical protein
MKALGIVAMLSVLLTLAACGGGSMSNTTPPPTTFTIGGTVTGLAGSGLVLQNNGGNNLTIQASGKFTFTGAISSGASYKVTVMTQPSSPSQSCAVTGGSGTATGNVTNVAVACTTNTYTVGGTITGLSGTGLVLQDNQGDNLNINANQTSFTFATPINSGAAYAVTVLTQPASPTQACVVTGGSGTAGAANVTSVAINCTTDTYTIGGTITGLAGTGLQLQDNGGDTLSVSGNTFTFRTSIKSDANYKVTILTQPANPVQNCLVTSGSGTVVSADVTDVAVTCATVTYTIGGTVAGLSGGGLALLNNGGNNLPISANGAFTFTTAVNSGATYSVTVGTQPTSPWQTCAVTSGGGTATANVTSVAITCTTNTYTIGGSVTGLLGSGLVLQDNGGDNQTIAAPSGFSQSFNFNTLVASGSTYAVTILTQPSSPAQTCWLGKADGSNAAPVQGANVTSVRIGCSDNWVYENGPEVESGPEIVNQNGSYGTLGLYATANLPGTRYSASSWTDTNGNYWLFGGFGYDSGNTTAGNLNDLWEYSPSMSEWRWVAGSSSRNQKGVYTGTPYPGARDGAVTWTDASGNFWLFGGFGYDSGTLAAGDLNDLWKYDPTTNTWTYVSGSNLVNQPGVYSGAEVPGARDSAVGWIDGSGNLWLFGGEGYDSTTTFGDLNDLWEFNTGTSTWTWVKGADLANQPGFYGTLGKSASANVPGGRFSSVTWIDKSGNLWLFGGFGKDGDTPTNTAELNDLWEYSTGANSWTWIGGSHIGAASGVYGSQTAFAAANAPGARQGAAGWTDGNGNFWLFGGLGFDSVNLAPGEMNDLWQYNVGTGQWAWISGSTTNGGSGVYGALAIPDPTAVPGARGGSSGWIDSSGNLWLFGGNGPKSGVNGSFNDLWEFQP